MEAVKFKTFLYLPFPLINKNFYFYTHPTISSPKEIKFNGFELK